MRAADTQAHPAPAVGGADRPTSRGDRPRGRGRPARRRLQAACLAAVTVIAGGGCLGAAGGGKVPAGATLVQVYHMAFRPRIVTVKVGQTVTWRFEDAGVEHNVDSRSGGFLSPDRDSGTWSHTFVQAGTFSYFCSIHPYMTAQVIVVADPAPTTAS